MGLTDVVDKFLDRGSGTRIKVYECEDCDATYKSARDSRRASCPECLSSEVTQVGTADSYS